MAAYRSGDVPLLTDTEMDDYLAAPTPLAYWHKRRGLTQAALARSESISQPYLAQIETGARTGDVTLYRRLAERLDVSIEELAPADR